MMASVPVIRDAPRALGDRSIEPLRETHVGCRTLAAARCRRTSTRR